jgi:hypothetical protein
VVRREAPRTLAYDAELNRRQALAVAAASADTPVRPDAVFAPVVPIGASVGAPPAPAGAGGGGGGGAAPPRGPAGARVSVELFAFTGSGDVGAAWDAVAALLRAAYRRSPAVPVPSVLLACLGHTRVRLELASCVVVAVEEVRKALILREGGAALRLCGGRGEGRGEVGQQAPVFRLSRRIAGCALRAGGGGGAF